MNIALTPREKLSHAIKSKGKSKYRGVRQKGNKWESSINIDKKFIYLGSYHTEYEAHLAYENALKDKGLTNKYSQ